MIINSIKDLLLESVHPNVERAKNILLKFSDEKIDEKSAHKLALKMANDDPYPDKRFTTVFASWTTNKIKYEEHIDDIKKFKDLRSKIKNMRINVLTDKDKHEKQKKLLGYTPRIFQMRFSEIGKWIKMAEELLDLKSYEDIGLPKIGEIDNGNFKYVMYRIDNKSDCDIPIIKGMSYCITKKYFGHYGGPPYYPVFRINKSTGIPEQFAMIIPNIIDKNRLEAIRNANNDGRLNKQDEEKIKPLIKLAIPKGHESDYANYILHKNKKVKLPDVVNFNSIVNTFNKYEIDLSDWPEAEEFLLKVYYPDMISFIMRTKSVNEKLIDRIVKENEDSSKDDLYFIARNILKARLPRNAEKKILESSGLSCKYALYIIEGRWPEAEDKIAKDPSSALIYANDVIKGRWPKGEDAIYRSSDPVSVYYDYVEPYINGPDEKFEKMVEKYPQKFLSGGILSYLSKKKKARWPAVEDELAKSAYASFFYAKNILNGPFPKGEKAIQSDFSYAEAYENLFGKIKNNR